MVLLFCRSKHNRVSLGVRSVSFRLALDNGSNVGVSGAGHLGIGHVRNVGGMGLVYHMACLPDSALNTIAPFRIA